MELDTLFRDVASVLSEKCINPESNRPYTISMLERALRDVHFSVDPKRPAKAQALEVGPGQGRRGGTWLGSATWRIARIAVHGIAPACAESNLVCCRTRGGQPALSANLAGRHAHAASLSPAHPAACPFPCTPGAAAAEEPLPHRAGAHAAQAAGAAGLQGRAAGAGAAAGRPGGGARPDW